MKKEQQLIKCYECPCMLDKKTADNVSYRDFKGTETKRYFCHEHKPEYLQYKEVEKVDFQTYSKNYYYKKYVPYKEFEIGDENHVPVGYINKHKYEHLENKLICTKEIKEGWMVWGGISIVIIGFLIFNLTVLLI